MIGRLCGTMTESMIHISEALRRYAQGEGTCVNPGEVIIRFFILLDDLLNSALRHFNVLQDLFCACMLAILTKDKTDLRLVQFHILDYVSKFRWEAK